MTGRVRVDIEADFYDLRKVKTVAEFQEWANSVIEQVPSEFRDGAPFEWDSDYDDGSWSLRVYYYRPETDSERMMRERQEGEAAARAQSVKYAEEKALYERLKAKFENC